MAYGQFTGYEPAGQPGAYNFGLANGQSVSLFGPEAEDLRAKIDASNAMQPQATAQNMSTADQNMSVDAQGGQNMSVGTPQPEPAPPTVIPETAVEGQAPAPQPTNVGFGLVRTPDGQLAQYRPGSAGVSQAALQRKSTQGTAIPVSASETVRGGFAPSEEYLEGMSDVSIAEQQNADMRAERDMMVAEQAAQVARDQQIQAGAQLAEQQRAQTAVEVRVARDEEIKNKAFRAFETSQIDPGRLFRGDGGTGRAIAATLGGALGAFGAALTKTPNFAMELINGAIERDIRAQEAEISVKKQSADNALADLQKSGLTMEQSKGLLRQLQQNYAAKQAQSIVASNQAPEVVQRHQEWMAEHQKQRLQFEENYRIQSAGEATKAVASQVVYPQAGSRGGYAPLSPKEQIGLAQDLKTLRKEDAPAGSATNNARLDAAEGTVLANEDALAKYDQTAIPKVEGTGNVAQRAERATRDFVGGAGAYARSLPAEQRAMIQDVETAKQAIKSMQSVLSEQGALSGPEGAAADRGLAPGATVGEVRRANSLLAERLRQIRGVKGQR